MRKNAIGWVYVPAMGVTESQFVTRMVGTDIAVDIIPIKTVNDTMNVGYESWVLLLSNGVLEKIHMEPVGLDRTQTQKGRVG